MNQKIQEKTYKAFENYIHSVIQEFIPILLLQQYFFTVEKYKGEKAGLIMECELRYPYLDATIRYSEKAFDWWKNEKSIKPYIVHELAHLITDPFYSKATQRFVSNYEIEDEREKLTDLISNIVLKLRNK